jgi:hypothetical protein
VVKGVFVRLVRLGDTGGTTRRIVRRAEFTDETWPLVQCLAGSEDEARLVAIAGEPGQETVEIVHEALVTQWPRYQAWLEDAAPDKRVFDRLIDRAAEWAGAAAEAKDGLLARTDAEREAFAGLARTRPPWLSAEERAFVEASVADHEVRLRREEGARARARRLREEAEKQRARTEEQTREANRQRAEAEPARERRERAQREEAEQVRALELVQQHPDLHRAAELLEFRASPERPMRTRARRRVSAMPVLSVVVAGAITVATAAYLFRHELGAALSVVAKLLFGVGSVSLTSTSGRRRSEVDRVLAGAFAPQICTPGASFLVQVVLCRTSDAAKAARMAANTDPKARLRGKKVLNAEIEAGDEVVVELTAEAQVVDEPRQMLVWRGEPESCQFFVTTSPNTSPKPIGCCVRLVRNSVPVGSLRFVVRCGQTDRIDPEPMGDHARRYRRAFLSYASEDRVEVLKRAQVLQATQISFFQDLLSLDPGERWKQRLYNEIDHCDLFLLFWSTNAKNSKWVAREIRRALVRQKGNDESLPDITPVILEGPPPPARPKALNHVHFDDKFNYLVAAIKVAQDSRPTSPSE